MRRVGSFTATTLKTSGVWGIQWAGRMTSSSFCTSWFLLAARRLCKTRVFVYIFRIICSVTCIRIFQSVLLNTIPVKGATEFPTTDCARS
jgi:hypothetical protein